MDMAPWIQTRDGKKFDLLEPDPEVIDPTTLSIVLSRICRFGGHCRDFYSVAQHSLLVEILVDDPALKLPALLHDAHEAYWGFGDVCKPAKCMSPELRNILTAHTRIIDAAIAERFGFEPELFHHEKIKHADCVMLATEQRDLMEPAPFPWVAMPEPTPEIVIPMKSRQQAGWAFSDRLEELMGVRLPEIDPEDYF